MAAITSQLVSTVKSASSGGARRLNLDAHLHSDISPEAVALQSLSLPALSRRLRRGIEVAFGWDRHPTHQRGKIFDVFNAVLLGSFLCLLLYPLYYVCVVSLSHGVAVYRGLVGSIPIAFTLEPYRMVLRDPVVLTAYGNTILYTVAGTLVSLTLTVLSAYPLSRPRLVFRRFFSVLIVFTMLFQGGIIPTYLLVQRLGLLDTIWAVILPASVGVWYLFLLRSFFEALPGELEDSARIDGANDLQIMYRIVLPLSKAALATMVVYYSVQHWNSFFEALLYLQDESKFPLQMIIRSIVIGGSLTDQLAEMGSASGFIVVEKSIQYAIVVISILPIVIVYPVAQRYFVAGITVGATKG